MLRIKLTDLNEFTVDLLTKAGADRSDAVAVAEALLWADMRGRHPQGVSRIPVFAKRVQRKLIASPAVMTFEQVAASAMRLDAGNGFGHIAGRLAMEKAVAIAKEQGVGFVAVRNSNLYGAASYFCDIAAGMGCLSFTCTNAVAKVAPHGGRQPLFGTNPLAFGCPTPSGDSILVDLSTSALSGSDTRSRSETGTSLPPGVALDRDGNPTVNPADVASGALLPAAGAKGFGLALIVDILSGVLSGAAIGKEVGSIYNTWDKPVNTGHVFFAIDIKRFVPPEIFATRINMLLQWIHENPSADPAMPVRYPGEIRSELARTYRTEGIPLPVEVTHQLSSLASEFQVSPPW